MSHFNHAIKVVLEHEGGFVNDKDDSGGATNFGVSLRYLLSAGEIDGKLIGDFNGDGDVNIDDIRSMTEDQAKDIYRNEWWKKYGYEQIFDRDIATKIFDLSVNMGARQAHKLLQRATHATNFPTLVDGSFGKNTLRSINANQVPDLLLGSLKSEAACFYRTLIVKKPRFEKYRFGWLKRAYS